VAVAVLFRLPGRSRLMIAPIVDLLGSRSSMPSRDGVELVPSSPPRPADAIDQPSRFVESARVTTVLDVLNRAASDPAFASRFGREPLEAARGAGMQTRERADAPYLERRLEALARPLGREPGPEQLRQAAGEMGAALGLGRAAAKTEAARALLFLRDYRFHQRLLGGGAPGELEALVDRFAVTGLPPQRERGALLVTVHYGPFPLLWLWLKRAVTRSLLPPCTLLYDTRLYEPDVSPEQYGRLAEAGAVARSRSDLDLAALGVRQALGEAVRRLRSGETLLMFPDAAPIAGRERGLVCRVGRVEVAYPRGAAWLAERSGVAVHGVAIRPSGDGHTVCWGTPPTRTATEATVTATLQELLDLSVARDPAPWLAWFDDDGDDTAR
jgi:hypothetical protein